MADFKNVADFLHEHALDNAADPSANGYILGACNRYYYYVFRLIRKEIETVYKQAPFKHGRHGGVQIDGKYIPNIKQHLPPEDHNQFDSLCQYSIKIFKDLYDIRESSDYKSPQIIQSEDGFLINFTKEYIDEKTKKNIKQYKEYSINEVKEKVKIIEDNFKLISQFRKRAGYV